MLMHLTGVEHGYKCVTDRAEYFWHSGMCIVTHKPDHLLDAGTARRVEAERSELCPEHTGTVLHVVPRNIEMLIRTPLHFGCQVRRPMQLWHVRLSCLLASQHCATACAGCSFLQRWPSGCSDIPKWPKDG